MSYWNVERPDQKCILQAVQKYANLLGDEDNLDAIRPFMQAVWQYLCEDIGLYACNDNGLIWTYPDFYEYYEDDPDDLELHDQYPTAEDYIDDQLHSFGDFRELTGEEASPLADGDSQVIVCGFFIDLFKLLGEDDLANMLKQIEKDVYKDITPLFSPFEE